MMQLKASIEKLNSTCSIAYEETPHTDLSVEVGFSSFMVSTMRRYIGAKAIACYSADCQHPICYRHDYPSASVDYPKFFR